MDGWMMKERNSLSLLDVCMYVAGRVLYFQRANRMRWEGWAFKLFISREQTNGAIRWDLMES